MKLKAFAPDKILAHMTACSTPSRTDLPSVYTTWLCYTNLCPPDCIRLSHWLEHPSLRHRPDWKGFCMLSLWVLGANVSSFQEIARIAPSPYNPEETAETNSLAIMIHRGRLCATQLPVFIFAFDVDVVTSWQPVLVTPFAKASHCRCPRLGHRLWCLDPETPRVLRGNSGNPKQFQYSVFFIFLHAYSCLMWLQHHGAPGSFLQVQGSALCPTMHLLLQILFAVLAACKDGLIEFDGKRVHVTMHQILGVPLRPLLPQS